MDTLVYCMLWLLFTLSWVKAINSFFRGKKQLPPGPMPYPVIGNLLELGDKPHKSLAKLAKIHGPIMSLKFGQVSTVVFSSADMAKVVLQNHDSTFCNRMVRDAACGFDHQDFGMVWQQASTSWKNNRKICNLHIFNSQKLDANQDLRRKKIKDLLNFVQENCGAGEAIDIGQAAFNTTLNLLSNTIFSVDLIDSNGREFKDIVWGILSEIARVNLSDIFPHPVLKKLDLQGIRGRATNYTAKMLKVLDHLIDKRLKQREELVGCYIESNDMLDTLLRISQDKSVEIDRNDIKHLILDLLVAGTDTTSNTLEWAMAELFNNPEALSKTRLELEQVIGKGKRIEESDVTRLPYLQAVVKETLRLHPTVPLLVPRKAISNIEIGGFTVPKGAQVLVNAWAIGTDEATWANPYSFLPERFVGSNIDVKGRHFELIPFGAGRRICPGLPLVIRMLPLMLGSLINCFDWKLEHEKLDMEDEFGMTLMKAQPLRVIPLPHVM